MLKGLRKRESYEELINELGDDPIKQYPDRSASQIENSNYMSQLASGFREVIEQNDKLMKERTKELLLKEMAAVSGVSHTSLLALRAASPQAFAINTPPRTASPPHSPRTASPQSARSVDTDYRNQRLIFQERVFGPNIDAEAVFKSFQDMKEKEDELNRQRERMQNLITETRTILNQATSSNIHQLVSQAVSSSSTQEQQLQIREQSVIQKAEQEWEDMMKNIFFRSNLSSGGSSSSTMFPAKSYKHPKKFDYPNPEADDEPEITRKKKSSKKSSKKVKKSSIKSSKVLKLKDDEYEEKRVVKKEVPHTIKHETIKVIAPDYNGWKKRGYNRTFLIDQIRKRPDINFTITDSKNKKITMDDMIKMLLEHDNK